MVKEHKLHAAVKSNNLTNVLKVLEKYNKQKFRSSNKNKKIDFDQRDNLGLTVIHHAARNGSIEILETLLVHGSAFDVFDSHGLRPIGYACAEGHIKIVDFLLRWGSSANSLSPVEYLTPLHLSAMYGYVEIVQLLLRYKADPFSLNKDNKTPIDLACAYGKYNVINLLFSFTRNMAKQNKQTNSTNASDCYGARTAQTDQESTRCNRGAQGIISCTPKVERSLNHMGSSPYSSATNNNNNNCSTAGNICHSSSHRAKSRVVRNISFTEDDCHSPSLPHKNLRYSLRSNVRSNSYQRQDIAESQGQVAADRCVPPTLDAASSTDVTLDLRQNLREACFAVQARALMPFGSDFDDSRTISFETGDLITVLKQYHNGVMKGFVTSDGISSTGLFPSTFVVFINDHLPPVCCDKPINIYQSPERTPIPNRGKSSKERPIYLDLPNSSHLMNQESDNEDQEKEGSPILIPPQMSEIRTNVCGGDNKRSLCQGSLVPCGCEKYTIPTCAKTVGHCRPLPDLPSASINDFTYCLSLGPSLISAVSISTTNKRNSIASMDSGRGSATDSKSVVSGNTGAVFTGCSQPPLSPMHCCQQRKISGAAESEVSNDCQCHVCTVLPPTVPTPFHHHCDDQSSQLFYQSDDISPAGSDFLLPKANSFSQQISIDSLYYPCSMISLDDTQSSSGSSDRGGIDDVMVNWLYSVGLGSYADLLSSLGYDLATLTKATPEDLNACGITNPKDRHFMKTQLNRLSLYDGLPETMPTTIHEFLDGLKLLQYEELLTKQNFSKIEHVLGLTWEDLSDIGIQKLGHQKKLSLAMERLSRLSQCNNSSINYKQSLSPPSKFLQDKFGPVTQSRSFEELPYPAAIMADLEPQENMSLSRYKNLRIPPCKMSVIHSYNCGQLSRSDESVSLNSDVLPTSLLPGSVSAIYGHQEDMSLSSSASSCSQEDSGGKDDNRPSHNNNNHNNGSSSASHFAHDNMGTVRIKRPQVSLCQDSATDPS